MDKKIAVCVASLVAFCAALICMIYADYPGPDYHTNPPLPGEQIVDNGGADLGTGVPGSIHPVSPGSVFTAGGYISFEGLNISYDGDIFAITSGRNDIVLVSAVVVGVKKDGSYEVLQYPAFRGPDEAQYQKDMEENGWAIMEYTNMVRPGETLCAELSVFDFNAFDESYPPADIDGDGYYEIIFCVHPQSDESSVVVSTDDPESEVYKLPAE